MAFLFSVLLSLQKLYARALSGTGMSYNWMKRTCPGNEAILEGMAPVHIASDFPIMRL